MKPNDGVTAEIVVRHVRDIERGECGWETGCHPERELAVQLGVSRPSVRAGAPVACWRLGTSCRRATVRARSSPTDRRRSGPRPLSFLAALHGFTRDEMFEARRALELRRGGRCRARERRSRLPRIARRSHRMYGLARRSAGVPDSTTSGSTAPWPSASGNPILASLEPDALGPLDEHRRKTAQHGRD